jgi:hypothetical protein
MRKNGLFHGFTFDDDDFSDLTGLGERFEAECVVEDLRILGEVGVVGNVGEGGTCTCLGDSYDVPM